jgi:hypothetical protein
VSELQAGDTGQVLTRRRFIGAAASSVALLAVAPTACAFERSGDGTLDTAVIGGGIAGSTRPGASPTEGSRPTKSRFLRRPIESEAGS